ncbi:MAG TPA: GntR family transcriptional regulator [Burkholderiaceae bacterium]|nr:GntR family transcriptional regulator [Burkholderiaceae bacterium]
MDPRPNPAVMPVPTVLPTADDAAAAGASGTRASAVYSRLRRDIVTNKLRAGEKLRVESITTRYGVGPTPVREALNRLSTEGLVQLQDQRGFRVAPISRDDLLELTRTRGWLNEILLRESIRHGDETWEEGIVLAFHRLSRTPNRLPDDPGAMEPAWEQRHQAFHHALVCACPSHLLLAFHARLFESADRYRHLAAGRSPAGHRDVPDEHRAIMEAVLGRRTDEAIRLLNAHTELTTRTLLEVIDAA